mmetsp:Transcript_95586/g.252595  ORF Transcript_95586/g.252595 Transcript_95586/m.252595 type:complete len:301 (+) Transcript_95586:255-1157(+)
MAHDLQADDAARAHLLCEHAVESRDVDGGVPIGIRMLHRLAVGSHHAFHACLVLQHVVKTLPVAHNVHDLGAHAGGHLPVEGLRTYLDITHECHQQSVHRAVVFELGPATGSAGVGDLEIVGSLGVEGPPPRDLFRVAPGLAHGAPDPGGQVQFVLLLHSLLEAPHKASQLAIRPRENPLQSVALLHRRCRRLPPFSSRRCRRGTETPPAAAPVSGAEAVAPARRASALIKDNEHRSCEQGFHRGALRCCCAARRGRSSKRRAGGSGRSGSLQPARPKHQEKGTAGVAGDCRHGKSRVWD